MPRLRSRELHGSGGALQRAAEALARQVAELWSGAERARGLDDRAPLRWVRPRIAAFGPVSQAVRRKPDEPAFPALPGAALVTTAALGDGTVDDLFALYAGVPSGRLLVAGAPGAGKTSAAIRLVLDALEHRDGVSPELRALVPVPVMLTPDDWSPVDASLEDWLTVRLISDHACAAHGPGGADQLVENGLVSVVLDGIDDIPASIRARALADVASQRRLRVVVLGRTGTFAEAAAEGPLRGAAVVELRPLGPDEVVDHLVRVGGNAPPEAWARLVENLRASPESPVAHAARLPLVLGLLGDYAPRASIDELCDGGRYPSTAAVEDHLLDHLLVQAYTPQPGERRPPLELAPARELFGWLARSMGTSQDLAWWRIRDAEPGGQVVTRRVVYLGAAAGVFLMVGETLGYGFGPLAGMLAGSLTSRAAVAAAAQFAPLGPKRLGRFRLEEAIGGPRFGNGLRAGLASALAVWLFTRSDIVPRASLSTVGLAGVVTATAIWVACGFSRSEIDQDRPVTPLRSYKQDRANNMVAVSLYAVSTAAVAALVAGPVAALGAGLATVAFQSPSAQSFQLGTTSLRRLRSLRLMRVLDDASRRGVLRTAGPHFQFRHARLQRRLAGEVAADG